MKPVSLIELYASALLLRIYKHHLMIIGCQRIPFLPELAYLHCWSQKRRWKQFSSGNDLSTSSLQTAMKSFISLLSESFGVYFLFTFSSKFGQLTVKRLHFHSLLVKFGEEVLPGHHIMRSPCVHKVLRWSIFTFIISKSSFLESTSHILTWLAPTSYHKHSTVFCSNT